MRVRQLGDPILRQKANKVSSAQIARQEVAPVISQMTEVLNGIKAISDQNGNAISAPQIGHSVRIIVLRINDELIPLINPVMSRLSEQKMDFEEECFSFYNLRGVVKRYHDIKVDYLDQFDNSQTREFSGEVAALVQHEIDHLDGLVFLDHIEDPTLIRSVDYDLHTNTARLNQVRNMISYMTGVID